MRVLTLSKLDNVLRPDQNDYKRCSKIILNKTIIQILGDLEDIY